MYTEQDKKFLKILKDQGVSPTEAFARLAKVKGGGQQTSKAQPQTQEPDYFGKSVIDFLGNTAKGISNAGANAAATVGEGIGNVAGVAGQVGSFLDPIANAGRVVKTVTGNEGVFSGYKSPVEQIGSAAQSGLKQAADITRESSAKSLGMDKDNGWATTGNILGTVANVIGGAALGAEAGTAAGGAIGKGVASQIGGKAAAVAPKVAQFVGNSVGGTEAVNTVLEGKLASPEQLGAGLAIDTALFGLTKVGDKLGNYFYKRIVPTTPLQAGKDAKRGLDMGKVLSEETGVSFSKPEIQGKVAVKIKQLSKEMDDLIKAADEGNTMKIVKFGEKAGFTADDLFPEGSIDDVLKNKKLQLKFGDVEGVKGQINSTLDEFRATMGDKTLTLTEVQALKKKLGSSLSGMYSKTGDAKATAKELVNDIIRKNAKTIIEDNVESAAEINKRLSGLLTAEKRMAAKGNYSGYLTDMMAGLGYSGMQGAVGQNDPASFVKNLVLGVIGKRLALSTGAKTLAGQAAKNIGTVTPFISAAAKGAMSKLSPSD